MMDQIHDDHTPMIITRDGGKPAAVMMSFEDYSSHEETMHLLRSPRNAARLQEAIDELNAGGGNEKKLVE